MDEYLSGDVVEKLEQAKQYAEENEIYKQNVEFLEKVQPTPLQAHEISAGLGSRWIDEKYYKKFIIEHFKPNSPIDVAYSNYSNEWRIQKPYNKQSTVEANSLYGTKRMNAYELLETLLNQRSPKIFDRKTMIDPTTGKDRETYVINKSETIGIKEKATKLQDEFQKWIFDDPKDGNYWLINIIKYTIPKEYASLTALFCVLRVCHPIYN